MTIETFIYIVIAVIPILSAAYIPKSDIRRAFISYLTFHSSTWFTSIMLVQKGIIEYPVREFVKATKVNFIPQFIFYPSIFMWFILLYPKERGLAIKILHYFIFVSLMVWFIYFTHKYTGINRYSSTSEINIIIKTYERNIMQFGISHLFVNWFMKKEKQT